MADDRDLDPQHHLIYAAQSLEQADAIFWRNDDPDPESARYLVAVAHAHAAIAAALLTASSAPNPPTPEGDLTLIQRTDEAGPMDYVRATASALGCDPDAMATAAQAHVDQATAVSRAGEDTTLREVHTASDHWITVQRGEYGTVVMLTEPARGMRNGQRLRANLSPRGVDELVAALLDATPRLRDLRDAEARAQAAEAKVAVVEALARDGERFPPHDPRHRIAPDLLRRALDGDA